jgi:hypothetical protein
MAIYTTFFLCEPRDLPAAFPGWKLPLTQAVTRTTVNPFTREEITVETHEPEWDDVDPNELRIPEMGVVAIEGDYGSYLQQRLPPFVQTQPHWCAKGFTSVELKPLVAAATDIEDPKLEYALYAHPSVSATLEQLPDDFVGCLKAADEAELNSIAQKWAATMSTPEYTHSVSGERLEDDWTVDDALSGLRPIAELAKQQHNDQSMYLLTEA